MWCGGRKVHLRHQGSGLLRVSAVEGTLRRQRAAEYLVDIVLD